jgi:hypothetical protein
MFPIFLYDMYVPFASLPPSPDISHVALILAHPLGWLVQLQPAVHGLINYIDNKARCRHLKNYQ